MAGFLTTLYHSVFRKSSTFALAIIGGAFLFERASDVAADSLFDYLNKGKQWKDIRKNYE